MTENQAKNFLSDEDFREISKREPKANLGIMANIDKDPVTVISPSQEPTPDSLAASNEIDEHTLDSDEVNLEPQPSSDSSNEYFDDDEEFLRGDDTIVHENYDISLFKQDENVVSWEIVNFYKDGANPRGKTALRNDPPIMKISSSSGDTAEFLLTKEFSRSLGSVLQDVNRAYYGISPAKKAEKLTQEGIQNKFRAMGRWMLAHKFKTAVAVVVLALLATALFV